MRKPARLLKVEPSVFSVGAVYCGARVAMGWVEAPEAPEESEPSAEDFAEAEAAGEAQDA